eukprot:gene28534-37492_t
MSMSVVRTTILMLIFYAGPVTVWCLEYLMKKSKAVKLDFIPTYDSLIIFRNVVFAPLSEELVFRSILIPSLYCALACPSPTTSGSSSSVDTAGVSLFVARISPIWFGIAHLHHLIERLRKGQPLRSTIFTTLLQLTYTSIFGYISALLFMRTGSVFSSIWSHMICNVIGLPDMSFCSRQHNSALYPYRVPLVLLHGLGILAFSWALFPLTEPLSKTSLFWNHEIMSTSCICTS